MKKYLFIFIVIAAMSGVTAYAVEPKTDFKRCFKLCMKELDDKDKCQFICDDNVKP
ncbi:hypothetical protein KY495_13195 [Massilia sp. PAMC28688]|uniref:hypothetical protein n=1 Tax=Massilia sp. PAMC28688 TaxID=2861283 RepID=UPI001C6318C4|nr:hypothetical protein [Massilia sp. PAMC28688]QYF91753.1 hypothetical protein KY495_13195 [Massilia sp. PAMC28688]